MLRRLAVALTLLFAVFLAGIGVETVRAGHRVAGGYLIVVALTYTALQLSAVPMPWWVKRTGMRYFHRREKVVWMYTCRRCGCPVTDFRDDVLDSLVEENVVRHRCGKVRR